LVVVVVDV
jgi:hypothetical protein